MKELNNKDIILKDTKMIVVDILSQHVFGKFRMIVKTKLGYTVCDKRFPNFEDNPESIICGYKSGALHTVQFCPDGSDHYLTIFSRTGKKVKLIDESILANLKVGAINNMYSNTNLYSQEQYNAVNAKTWADNAFVENGPFYERKITNLELAQQIDKAFQKEGITGVETKRFTVN